MVLRRLRNTPPGEAHLGEKWPGNSSRALLEVTKVFFGAPEALGGRFLEAPNVLLRALGSQVDSRPDLGPKKVLREASGTLNIKVFVCTVCKF